MEEAHRGADYSRDLVPYFIIIDKYYHANSVILYAGIMVYDDIAFIIHGI